MNGNDMCIDKCLSSISVSIILYYIIYINEGKENV